MRVGSWLSAVLVTAVVVTGWQLTTTVGPAARAAGGGTATRPTLSETEAQNFTPEAYLSRTGEVSAPRADAWAPPALDLAGVTPDAVVGPQAGVGGATTTSVQAAVDAAVRAGGTRRIAIAVLPGTYQGAVYIPAESPPLLLYGTGSDAAATTLALGLEAAATPEQYAATVNPAGQYPAGSPASSMFTSCAQSGKATIGTSCSAAVWVKAGDVQLANLTMVNSLLDSVGTGTHQAVALRTDGDRIQLESVRLLGRQDTVLFNTPDAGVVSRILMRDSYVEGDTDAVFGRGTAVMLNSEFRLVSSRKPAKGVMFAPSTTAAWSFGFLVANCRLTTDQGYAGAPTASLGRAWDAGAGDTGYRPGTSPNGQLVIRDSVVDGGYDPVSPWAAAATTSRPFTANLADDRNLDDPGFNRLWEYRTAQPPVTVG